MKHLKTTTSIFYASQQVRKTLLLFKNYSKNYIFLPITHCPKPSNKLSAFYCHKYEARLKHYARQKMSNLCGTEKIARKRPRKKHAITRTRKTDQYTK